MKESGFLYTCKNCGWQIRLKQKCRGVDCSNCGGLATPNFEKGFEIKEEEK